MLPGLLTHACKECTHQLALPCGARHLITPKFAGQILTILLLLLQMHELMQSKITTHIKQEMFPAIRSRLGLMCSMWP